MAFLVVCDHSCIEPVTTGQYNYNYTLPAHRCLCLIYHQFSFDLHIYIILSHNYYYEHCLITTTLNPCQTLCYSVDIRDMLDDVWEISFVFIECLHCGEQECLGVS